MSHKLLETARSLPSVVVWAWRGDAVDGKRVDYVRGEEPPAVALNVRQRVFRGAGEFKVRNLI